MAFGQRIRGPGDVLQDEIDALTRHQFAGRDVVFRRGMRAAQQIDRRLGRRHGDPRGRHVLGLGPKLQHRLGDDAQGALGAEIKIAQVVAGIVFLERAQAVPDLARRRHDLEAEHEMARVAIVQHLHAAGVGREVAADGAAALGRKAQWKQAVVRGGRLLDGLQDDTGLDGHRVTDFVDCEDTVHAGERQHDFAAVLVRHATAHQAGVAALGHDRDPLRGAELYDARDFFGGRGPDHGKCRAEVIVAPVGEIGMLARVVGDQTLVADEDAQLFDEIAHDRRRILPGFMMFFGSSARLIERIVSSSIRER